MTFGRTDSSSASWPFPAAQRGSRGCRGRRTACPTASRRRFSSSPVAQQLLRLAERRIAAAQRPADLGGQLPQLGGPLPRDRRLDPPFSPPVPEGAARHPRPAGPGESRQISSFTSASCPHRSRNRRYSATSRRALSSSGPGFRCSVSVRPFPSASGSTAARAPGAPAPRTHSSASRTCGITAFSDPRRKSPTRAELRVARHRAGASRVLASFIRTVTAGHRGPLQ